MKNIDEWKPSKFIFHKSQLIASRDTKEIGIASRLIGDVVARFYDVNLKKYAKGRLLDLGCGKVPLFGAYKNFVTENICVDWSNTTHECSHLDYETDLTAALPFRDGEFDTIILSDVLEHIPVPEKLWSEMARILATDGKIIMNTPFYYWLHEEPHDYYRYTEFALRRFVNESGLELVHIESVGGALEVLADILAKIIQSIPVVGRLLSAILQWLASTLLRTSFGTAMSKRSGKKFPLGYGLIASKPKK